MYMCVWSLLWQLSAGSPPTRHHWLLFGVDHMDACGQINVFGVLIWHLNARSAALNAHLVVSKVCGVDHKVYYVHVI
jgi:hypothetical protein